MYLSARHIIDKSLLSLKSKGTHFDKSLGLNGEKGLDFFPAGDDNSDPTVISDGRSAAQGETVSMSAGYSRGTLPVYF